MYLALLNENQKHLFLEAANYLSLLDGEKSFDEQKMIEAYCYEMGMDLNFEVGKITSSDEIVNSLVESCGEKEKKIIIFELIGLAVADGCYDKEEKTWISEVRRKFGMSEEFGVNCEKMIQEYIVFQNQLNELILNK